jgi:hypothetical protein
MDVSASRASVDMDCASSVRRRAPPEYEAVSGYMTEDVGVGDS